MIVNPSPEQMRTAQRIQFCDHLPRGKTLLIMLPDPQSPITWIEPRPLEPFVGEYGIRPRGFVPRMEHEAILTLVVNPLDMGLVPNRLVRRRAWTS